MSQPRLCLDTDHAVKFDHGHFNTSQSLSVGTIRKSGPVQTSQTFLAEDYSRAIVDLNSMKISIDLEREQQPAREKEEP